MQCGICDLWAHYECTGLAQSTLDAYEVLVSSGDCDKPFKCSSCKAALSKFNADLNAMKVRMSGLENRQQETLQKVETIEAKQVNVEVRLEKVETKVKEIVVAGNSSKGVWEELKERERREANLIIHNVCEASSSDKRECEESDLRGLQKLFNLIGANMNVADSVKFTRREGEKRDNLPRPLKVVFRRKEFRDTVLANAHKLSRCDEEHWKKVSVVSDLTKLQRQDEADMRKEAAAKNLERGQEQIDKGEAWKVIGKRGSKRLQLVQLYKDEIVSELGEVRLKESVLTAKRLQGTDQSSNRPRLRQRVDPGEFGDRVQ